MILKSSILAIASDSGKKHVVQWNLHTTNREVARLSDDKSDKIKVHRLFKPRSRNYFVHTTVNYIEIHVESGDVEMLNLEN